MNIQDPQDFLLDVYAVKALFVGEATKEQQIRFWNWLCDTACGWGNSTQMPTDRDTSFANGQREVALKFKKMVTFDVASYKKASNIEQTQDVVVKKTRRSTK